MYSSVQQENVYVLFTQFLLMFMIENLPGLTTSNNQDVFTRTRTPPRSGEAWRVAGGASQPLTRFQALENDRGLTNLRMQQPHTINVDRTSYRVGFFWQLGISKRLGNEKTCSTCSCRDLHSTSCEFLVK